MYSQLIYYTSVIMMQLANAVNLINESLISILIGRRDILRHANYLRSYDITFVGFTVTK